MNKRTTVQVEFFYDDESRNWGFTCADPAIVGGGDRTLAAAARQFARALADTVQWEQEAATESEMRLEPQPSKSHAGMA
jgi:hypothetical protein